MTNSFHGHVFIAASVDGFIATADGGIEWLEEAAQGVGETGYQEFFDSVDALVMGRGTYDKALTFDFWPYAGKPVLVLTGSALTGSVLAGSEIAGSEITDDDNVVSHPDLDSVVAALERIAAGTGREIRVYVDGGKTIQSFLRRGLIDELVITRIPILLGRGIPLFGPLDSALRLDHVSSRDLGDGLLQSHYRVVPPVAG